MNDKNVITMWVNEEAFNEWLKTDDSQQAPFLARRKSKKYNMMVHVIIESPIHEEK